MKKLFVAIFAIALFASLSFSQTLLVNDNSGAKHDATSTFAVTVWVPLTIGTPNAVDFGVFVVSETPYTVNGELDFNLTGQPGQNVYWKTAEAIDHPDIATIAIAWTPTSPLVLNTDGKGVIKATASSLTALKAGSCTYTETVTVSYNSI
jgi:hypothetical protein